MTGPESAAKKERPPFNPAPSFYLTQNIDPEWTYGAGIRKTSVLASEWNEEEKQGWKSFNLEEMPKSEVYSLLISSVAPRPIAFVSTLSESGKRNLAPFSYFNLISHNPPLVIISFANPGGRLKDTPTNIKNSKEFVVNLISEPFLDAANITSIDVPPDVDEWVMSGLTPEPSSFVKPPRVRESAISFECTLYNWMDIHSLSDPSPAPPTHALVIGLIHHAHVRNAVLAPNGHRIEPERLRAVGRLGGGMYARLGSGLDLVRPTWENEAEAIRSLQQDTEQQNGTHENEQMKIAN